jgi:hypothetical protein
VNIAGRQQIEESAPQRDRGNLAGSYAREVREAAAP